MNRSVIAVATAIVIVIAGLIIFKIYGPPVGAPPPEGEVSNEGATEINDDPPGGRQPNGPQIVEPTPRTKPVTKTVSVSINAIPWARVFIKLPENDYFMEPRTQDFTIPPGPNQKEPNVTPIPGDLKVPSGTAIKLMYRGRQKIFPYEKWKDRKAISHDFLNQ